MYGEKNLHNQSNLRFTVKQTDRKLCGQHRTKKISQAREFLINFVISLLGKKTMAENTHQCLLQKFTLGNRQGTKKNISSKQSKMSI